MTRAVLREICQSVVTRWISMATAMIDTTVAESRTAQGLPPKVTDPAVLRRVARLISNTTSDEHSDDETRLVS